MILVEGIRGRLCADERRRVEHVALGWEDRLRSRQRLRSDSGTELGVALQTGQPLREGDILFEDEERVVAVVAIPEDMLVLHPESPVEMGRLCYQVGNRHAPICVRDGRVLTPYDSVLEAYFVKMGVRCEKTKEPFTHDFGAFHSRHH